MKMQKRFVSKITRQFFCCLFNKFQFSFIRWILPLKEALTNGAQGGDYQSGYPIFLLSLKIHQFYFPLHEGSNLSGITFAVTTIVVFMKAIQLESDRHHQNGTRTRRSAGQKLGKLRKAHHRGHRAVSAKKSSKQIERGRKRTLPMRKYLKIIDNHILKIHPFYGL
jgi:hypothetical protein